MEDEDPANRFKKTVAQMFMQNDGFFSPIMRDKIPQMLFSNGSNGLDRMFPLNRPSSAQPFRSLFEERSESPASVVRHVPIRVHPNSNNGPQRFENSHSISETDSDSSGTLRRVESPAYGSRRPSNLYSDRSSLAPSLSRRSTPSPQPPQFTQQSQLSRSATPTESSNINSHRLPPYYPQRHKQFISNSNNSSFETLPPRSDRLYERQPCNPKPRPPFQSTSNLKLSCPSNESSSPNVAYLRRTHTSQDVLDEPERRRSEPEKFSTPLERHDSEPAIALYSRPSSRLSAKSRSKSPSITSLKQGLKKANFISQCLTKQNKSDQKDPSLSVDVEESVYKPPENSNYNKSKKVELASPTKNGKQETLPSPTKTGKKEQLASPTKSGKSSFLLFWQRPSRTQSTPSLLTETKPLSLSRPLELDPVEKAIKDLENFDPNEYIKSATNNQSKDPTRTNSSATNGKNRGSLDALNSKNAIEKLGPTSLQRTPYGSVNLPYTATLPPIPKVDYNIDPVPKMGNTTTKQKPPNVAQREPQHVTFQTPPVNGRSETDSRKRALKQQMTDSAKSIELQAIKLNRIASVPNWRNSKSLEQTLPTIRDIAFSVDNSLYDLIDGTARVSIQRSDPAHHELQLLINPIRTAHSMIRRLRTTLNLTNWSVSLLSRPTKKGMENTNDSLDQFVAILKHLPNDCSKLVQFIYHQDRLNMMSFLPVGVSTAAPPPNQQDTPYQSRQPPNQQNTPPVYSALRRDKPSFLNTRNPNWQGEMVDGGESTTSTSSNDSNPMRSTDDESTPKHSSSGTPNQRNRDEDSIIDEELIMEEDDLASVVSDQQSPTWHNTPGFQTTKMRQNSGDTTRRQLQLDVLKKMTEEERDFIQFCAPQIQSGVETLNKLIEDFFNTIEAGHHPNKFSQKIKLISIQSMTLVNFASNVARHANQAILRAEFKHSADSIDSLATECENRLEIAKKQHPSVSAIQQLVSAVVSLSKAAQNLKLITKTCQFAANTANDSR